MNPNFSEVAHFRFEVPEREKKKKSHAMIEEWQYTNDIYGDAFHIKSGCK